MDKSVLPVKNDIGRWFDSFFQDMTHLFLQHRYGLEKALDTVSHVFILFYQDSLCDRVNKLKCHFSTSFFFLVCFSLASSVKGTKKNLIICCLTIFYEALKYERKERILWTRVNKSTRGNVFIWDTRVAIDWKKKFNFSLVDTTNFSFKSKIFPQLLESLSNSTSDSTKHRSLSSESLVQDETRNDIQYLLRRWHSCELIQEFAFLWSVWA